MFITGLGTAVPAQQYSQGECWDALQAAPQFPALRAGSRALLRKILLGDNGIARRYLALNPLSEAFELHPDTLQARFLTQAPALATQAAERALARAGIAAADLDAILISTCTGYLCPGLTSYVCERLGTRNDVLTLDLVGQGCGAALPNLRTAEALITAGRGDRVLSVAVEVCSAAFYLDDDPGVLVSACLFGDGAGAVVLSAHPRAGGRRVAWQGAASLLSPGERDELRFEQRGGMLRNILTRQVPALAAQHATTVLERALAKLDVPRSRLTGWMLHAGGRDVLLALQRSLKLKADDLTWSAQVLREHGNMSSPSVLFALEAAFNQNAPGGFWWLTSFGAGFTCHGALLAVE